MSDEHESELAALFHRANALDSRARAELLATVARGEPELAREVAHLLRCYVERPDFLEDLHVRVRSVTAHWIGRRVGGFRIESLLAEGGMAQVFVAEQERPRRRVALKLVRALAGGANTLARFEREAEILAALDHPGIAKVLEAGSTDTADGERPYLAIELIDGEPITRFASSRAPDVRARLALFVQVCDAVQHAHEKGVIHRDLKPANVLVDRGGTVKVLDFGIARVFDDKLRRGATLTADGQVLGTPAYMSPEHFAARSGAVDVRSDVYSLGVMLFELLTGRLPIETGELASARLAELAQFAARVAHEVPRRASSLRPELSRDLDVILAKALEKDPARRYASAADLAGDVRAFQEHRPISARPPSVVYRASRWVRREPFRAALGALVAAVLISPAILKVAGFVVANRDEVLAMRARDADERLEHALERAYYELGQPVNGGAVRAFESVLAANPGDERARAGYALALTSTKQTAAALAALGDGEEDARGPRLLDRVRIAVLDAASDGASARALADSLPPPRTADEYFFDSLRFNKRGKPRADIAHAIDLLEEAVARSERPRALLFFQLTLAASRMGDPALLRTRALQLEYRWPDSPVTWFYVGNVFAEVDRERATRAYERAVELEPSYSVAHHNLGAMYRRAGDEERALACQLRAVELDPKNSLAHHSIGAILQNREQHCDALVEYELAVRLDANYADAHGGRGWTLIGVEMPLRGLEAFQRCLECQPSLPTAVRARRGIACALELLGERGAAIAELDRAIWQQPENALARVEKARMLEKEHDLGAAIASVREAAAITPSDFRGHELLARLLAESGDCFELRDALERWVGALPEDEIAWRELARYLTDGAREPREHDAQRALEAAMQSLAQSGDDPEIRRTILEVLGAAWRACGDEAAAEALHEP